MITVTPSFNTTETNDQNVSAKNDRNVREKITA